MSDAIFDASHNALHDTGHAADHDDCNCCEGLPLPARPANAAGLTALRYRIDTHPGFRARMVQSLPLLRSNDADPLSPAPLSRLLTRRSDDPSMALLDAAACVADVLTFYQERIANEGYLNTATERRSVLELARAVGYALRPGVAASVHLSFTVEDAPGAPGVSTLPAGLPVQSIPPQGKAPQVFETRDAIVARAEWNALRPRLMRPADIAVLDIPAQDAQTVARNVLALVGPAGSFGVGPRKGLHQGLQTSGLYRIDPSLPADAKSDAIEINEVFLSDAGAGSGTGLAGGDLMLFAARRGTGLQRLILRVVAVTSEPMLHRVRLAVEPLPEPTAPAAPQGRVTQSVPYASSAGVLQARYAGLPRSATLAMTQATVVNAVTSRTWRESELQTLIGMQGWSQSALTQTVTASAMRSAASGAVSAGSVSGKAASVSAGRSSGVSANASRNSSAGASSSASATQSVPAVASVAGAFAFGAKLGFFGNNAPRWGMLPKPVSVRADPYPLPWDRGDTPESGQALESDRTIWQTSQAKSQGARVYLERAVPEIVPASWVVIDSPVFVAEPYAVADARAVSRADFGLSGRAMEVALADGATPPGTLSKPEFSFRSSTAHVASRKLEFVALPIDAPVPAGSDRIDLDMLVLGLSAGQALALTGTRADLPGVDAAEIAMLVEVVHIDGRTVLQLKQGLQYSYVRSSLRINANTVAATHGESVREVLGNGDATQIHQRFVLKRPPTTWVSAATPDGVISTLTIRVNGIRWDPVPSLYGVGPHETVYTTRVDDDGRTEVLFGDGISGARLPTAMVNIEASYRTGIGPDGEVAANTLTMPRAMPLGMRGVTNPLPATGAADREHLADAQVHTPRSLQAFDRVVSLLDYGSYARVYPGIGKARADVLWVDGLQRVFLSVTGATGGAPGQDVLANLSASIAAVSDPSQRFSVGAYRPLMFRCHARILHDPRRVRDEVKVAVVAAMLTGFGFDARDLGQPVTAAEVIARIQGVPGVVAVDLDVLALLDGAASGVPAGLPAYGARWDAATRRAIPAELLVVSPDALEIGEMTP